MKVCTHLMLAQCFSALRKDGPTAGFLEVGAMVGLIIMQGIFEVCCTGVLVLGLS